MTAAWEFVFWVSAAGVLYAYVGYAFVLLVLARFGRARTAAGGEAPGGATQPTVSMLIPMHNEAACIADKLENTLAMDYPREKLEVVVVSDGSTDGSAEIVRSFALRGVRLAELERRGGKAAALNRGLDLALHEIVVFSDASIQLAADALREIVLPFADPSVGCVSGEDRIPGTSGEGFYGRYELLLRRLESEVGSIVGASGCFYAQRRSLCEPFPPGLAPDFLSVLNVVERGYRAVSRPQAIGYMRSLGSTAGEFQRKARTLVRGMTALLAKRALLNPVRFGTFSLELLSHKLMRWLVPVFLLGALVSNAMLWDVPPYRPVLWLQAAFYALALLGVVGGAWARERLWCRIPLYFTIANAAILVAWVRFLRGERQELWAPSRRA